MICFGHENLKVRDLDAATGFYWEQFGLEVIREMVNGAKQRMAWLAYEKDAAFFLELTEDEVTPGNNHIAFVTDGQEALLERHRALGIVDSEIPHLGIHFIHDPDGNSIEIMSAAGLATLRGDDA